MDEANSNGSVAAFLTKLWSLLEDSSYEDFICWNVNGTSFHIIDQTSFAQNVLPVFFKHRNISSFIRQLNMYGFRKVSALENGGMKIERDDIEFAHPYFIRGREDLLEHIKRKASVSRNEPTAVPKPDDVRLLMQEVQKLRERQEAFTSKMDAMKRENSALWKELAVMWQRHNKQQQIVGKLLQFLVNLMGKRANSTLKRSLLASQSTDQMQPSMAKISRPTSLTLSSNAQLSTVHDTTLTIEDVTDIDDAIATTSSLLSPSTNDTENMFLDVDNDTPDLRAIWNDHGQLAASVELPSDNYQSAIVIEPLEEDSKLLQNLHTANKPLITVATKNTMPNSQIIPKSPASSLLKSAIQGTLTTTVAGKTLAAGLAKSTTSPSNVANHSAFVKSVGAQSGTKQSTKHVMVGLPTNKQPVSSNPGSSKVPITNATTISNNLQLRPRASPSQQMSVAISKKQTPMITSAKEMSAPVMKAPLKSSSPSSLALLPQSRKVMMKQANKKISSPNITEKIQSPTDISTQLDLTQADLESLQNLLATSQVTLNFDALKELFSPESPLSVLHEQLIPVDSRSNHDELTKFISEEEFEEYPLTEELTSLFNVDDFIDHNVAAVQKHTS